MTNILALYDLTNEQTKAAQYILHEYPRANMNPDFDFTVVDIVIKMEDLTRVDQIVTFFKQGFEENEIVCIINKSEDLIQLMYKLMLDHNVERENAVALICLSNEDMQIALSFIHDHHIDNEDLSTILYNKCDNMFTRMQRLIQYGAPILFAHMVICDNNDTDEIIMKVMHFVNYGMDILAAYDKIISQ
jgi:hypothetical protein